ncbi:mucin-15 [Platysternon megacephalum]|uniref:Mucin-15 n=1 Tax=Platysternon megacephalum TaxID=55544 RepID=A0A4D9DJA7_9SAUR|nr:mucin-15 [Platysternon megacephalum]
MTCKEHANNMDKRPAHTPATPTPCLTHAPAPTPGTYGHHASTTHGAQADRPAGKGQPPVAGSGITAPYWGWKGPRFKSQTPPPPPQLISTDIRARGPGHLGSLGGLMEMGGQWAHLSLLSAPTPPADTQGDPPSPYNSLTLAGAPMPSGPLPGARHPPMATPHHPLGYPLTPL